MTINILFPVLNEEKRLELGIRKTVDFLENIKGIEKYQLTIVDNGSQDATGGIAQQLVEQYEQVEYICIPEKGVGIAFKTGVLNNSYDIVGYMDIDLSTDVTHLEDVIHIFSTNQDVQMVNGSRYNRETRAKDRRWYRYITSYGLIYLLKLTLHMKASDAICGFKFFKKDAVLSLMEEATDNYSWFYIIELLLRAERSGMNIYELPVRWEDDSSNTTVNVRKVIANYLTQIKRLRKEFKNEKREKHS